MISLNSVWLSFIDSIRPFVTLWRLLHRSPSSTCGKADSRYFFRKVCCDRREWRKERKQTFSLCTSFCKLHQHWPMGNQCTDFCCVCQWNVWWCNPKKCTHVAPEPGKQERTNTHTHTQSGQGQLNRKRMSNEVSFSYSRLPHCIALMLGEKTPDRKKFQGKVLPASFDFVNLFTVAPG